MSRLTPDTSPTLVIEKRLGAGSYGTVYKGKWGVFPVAAKKFHISTKEAAQDSIKREIKALEVLSFRHVIQFYGTVYHRGHLVLLTDLAEGGSLALAIQKGIKDWSTKERFAREMLLGLAYIHSKGVLHLDLKSENVLLSHSMEVKLCDFGCSTIKTTSAARSTESHRGTVRWTAPEIFVPKPKYSTKSDMYSLGMVMWEMAANCTTPFKGHLDNSIIISLVREGVREELPEDIPVQYRRWVERCWNMDPSKRPEAMEYFQETERAEKREGTPDDTLETDKTSESRDMTSMVSFSLDGFSVISRLTDEEDVGNNTSSNKSMVTMQRTIAHKISPIEYVRASVDTSRSHSIFRANERHLHERSSGQSDTDQAVGIEDANHIHLLSSDFDMLSTLLGLSEKNENGRGVEKNDMEIVEWYTKAANDGDPNAQYNFGLMYRKGREVEQSDAKAIEWYTKAANQGNADAQYNLGLMYRNAKELSKMV
ncbi:hypothetical protein BGW42_002701 [Actinomortierella wolfii]|nr:hypothetical protein BGW42_002701 [Actinomortierella wolfii]